MLMLLSIFLGVTLAAAAGFRAFLPLFLLGLLERYQLLAPFSLGESFQWLSSDHALIALGTATFLEILADKIPAVDSGLDAAMTFVRPGAGALSVIAVLSPQDPVLAYVSGLVFATGATLPIHLGKSALRLGSHATTAGAGSPVLSAAEDVSSGVAVVLAVLIPVCAVVIGATSLVFVIWVWRKRKRKKRSLS